MGGSKMDQICQLHFQRTCQLTKFDTSRRCRVFTKYLAFYVSNHSAVAVAVACVLRVLASSARVKRSCLLEYEVCCRSWLP